MYSHINVHKSICTHLSINKQNLCYKKSMLSVYDAFLQILFFSLNFLKYMHDYNH